MNYTTNFFFRCAVAEGPAARLRERALKPMKEEKPKRRDKYQKERTTALERRKNNYI